MKNHSFSMGKKCRTCGTPIVNTSRGLCRKCYNFNHKHTPKLCAHGVDFASTEECARCNEEPIDTELAIELLTELQRKILEL